MLLPKSASHNRNHNQICIASQTESYEGAECIRPIPEPGAIATFYIFLFFVFGRKCWDFLFSFIFRPENEIAFSVLFIFRPKKENPFTVGLYRRCMTISCIRLTDDITLCMLWENMLASDCI